MNRAKYIFPIMMLLMMVGCSSSDDEEKKPLENHVNKGDMGKQLQGSPFEGYGQAIDKAHNVTGTLQQGADQTKAQIDQQSQ